MEWINKRTNNSRGYESTNEKTNENMGQSDGVER